MLQSYVTHEVKGGFTIGPEVQDDPCFLCRGESMANTCPGDGRLHYHGRVHVPGGGLEPVCSGCLEHVKAQWQMHRGGI
jgi:hypothetical protein